MTGYPAYGGSISNSSTAVQLLERSGEILVNVRVIVEDDYGLAGDSAGDKLNCTITVQNAGTTTLNSITVSSVELMAQLERYDIPKSLERSDFPKIRNRGSNTHYPRASQTPTPTTHV